MPPIIYGRVGDEKMQTITVKISRRDEIPDLSGGVITFEGEPAGGKVKVFDSENVSSNNAGLQKGTFEYTFPSAAFSVEGTYKRAYFSFQKDGKRDTTGDFKIIVKGNADIDAEEAETIITEYNKLVTALNEAYQAALKKIDADYDAVVARIESIKKEMNVLQAKIDKTVSDAEGRISKVATDSETKITTIGKTVTDAMNAALEELRAADFYTRVESDEKFIAKGDAYTKQESDEKLVTKEFYQNDTKAQRQRWKEGLNWIAHRGNNTEYPENSIPAFKTVRRHWGIETDIQVTSDGQWVVMHDDTVDRTTNGTGKVSSMTLAQFRNLRIDAGANVSKLSDEEKTPPTFEEYLKICKELNKVPVIEVKSGTYSKDNFDLLKDTLDLYGYGEANCVIGSFGVNILNTIRTYYPNIELHYFVDAINESVITQIKKLGVPAAVSCSYSNSSLSTANVKALHMAGFKVGTWTVPENKFADMTKLGIDYITTNSLSGNQKYAKLSYQNGFVDNQGITDASYVEELVGGGIHINFNVEKGGNTQNTVIANLPDWAIPLKSQYSQCGIRTSSGVALGTFDIRGRTAPTGVVAGTLSVGLNWSGRSSWAAGSTVYAV
ncbi:glycerophosphodiester phosphodiesterase family protein [Enterococcus sp. DIV1368f]